MKFWNWFRAHFGNNQDFYLWPLVIVTIYGASSWIVSLASGHKPLADMAVNLQALNGYAIESVPIFLSLLWASLAARFLAWTWKTYEEWNIAPWSKQLIDILVPLTVFIVCMHHYDIRS